MFAKDANETPNVRETPPPRPFLRKGSRQEPSALRRIMMEAESATQTPTTKNASDKVSSSIKKSAVTNVMASNNDNGDNLDFTAELEAKFYNSQNQKKSEIEQFELLEKMVQIGAGTPIVSNCTVNDLNIVVAAPSPSLKVPFSRSQKMHQQQKQIQSNYNGNNGGGSITIVTPKNAVSAPIRATTPITAMSSNGGLNTTPRQSFQQSINKNYVCSSQRSLNMETPLSSGSIGGTNGTQAIYNNNKYYHQRHYQQPQQLTNLSDGISNSVVSAVGNSNHIEIAALKEKLTQKADELNQLIETYEKDVEGLRQQKKAQERLVQEMKQQKEELTQWIVEQKQQTENYCNNEKKVVEKERRMLYKETKDLKQKLSERTNAPTSVRKEKEIMESLQTTIEKYKIDAENMSKKHRLTEQRLNQLVKEQHNKIHALEEQVSQMEQNKTDLFNYLNEQHFKLPKRFYVLNNAFHGNSNGSSNNDSKDHVGDKRASIKNIAGDASPSKHSKTFQQSQNGRVESIPIIDSMMSMTNGFVVGSKRQNMNNMSTNSLTATATADNTHEEEEVEDTDDNDIYHNDDSGADEGNNAMINVENSSNDAVVATATFSSSPAFMSSINSNKSDNKSNSMLQLAEMIFHKHNSMHTSNESVAESNGNKSVKLSIGASNYSEDSTTNIVNAMKQLMLQSPLNNVSASLSAQPPSKLNNNTDSSVFVSLLQLSNLYYGACADSNSNSINKDDCKVTKYKNGTVKEVFASTNIVMIYFMNGDIKRTIPYSVYYHQFNKNKGNIVNYFDNSAMELVLPSVSDGLMNSNELVVTEYLYKECNTLHTTFPIQLLPLDMYQFGTNRQIEKHYKNGTKDVLFSNGTKKLIQLAPPSQ